MLYGGGKAWVKEPTALSCILAKWPMEDPK